MPTKFRREPIEIAAVVGNAGLVDWAIDDNGDLLMDHGLVTSVLLSLWTDRRLEAGDVHPLTDEDGDPRGWCLEGNRRIGSHIWRYMHAEATTEKRRRIELATEQALRWLTEQGIAEKVVVIGSWLARGAARINVAIKRGAAKAWPQAWDPDPFDRVVHDELGNEIRIVSFY